MRDAEAFADWMLLEAKASREGMPVDPVVEDVALCVDRWMRDVCSEFMRIANEHADEIEEFHRGCS